MCTMIFHTEFREIHCSGNTNITRIVSIHQKVLQWSGHRLYAMFFKLFVRLSGQSLLPMKANFCQILSPCIILGMTFLFNIENL